jgi:hypothetical protein
MTAMSDVLATTRDGAAGNPPLENTAQSDNNTHHE